MPQFNCVTGIMNSSESVVGYCGNTLPVKTSLQAQGYCPSWLALLLVESQKRNCSCWSSCGWGGED